MCQTEKEALMSDRNILSKLMCLLIFFSELCILVFNLKLKSNSFPLKSNLFPVTTIIKQPFVGTLTLQLELSPSSWNPHPLVGTASPSWNPHPLVGTLTLQLDPLPLVDTSLSWNPHPLLGTLSLQLDTFPLVGTSSLQLEPSPLPLVGTHALVGTLSNSF